MEGGDMNGISSEDSGMTPNRVLSIQSHVVSGYVGNKCAVFPLQVLGFDVDFVNSVQFSNHTGYGFYRGQVLQERDLDELFVGLETNDLVNYTQVLTGYVGSDSFLRKISQVVRQVKEKCPGTIYLCDPVLGDNGKFYVPESLIPIYQKEVLPLADITTPNTFELQLLSGMKVTSEAEALEAMNILHNLGVPIVVLTSLDSGGPLLTTYVSQKQRKSNDRSVWKLDGERMRDVSFTGAGDLFSALFLAWFSKTQGSIPRTLELVTATMESVLGLTMAKGKLQEASSKIKGTELQLIQSLEVIRDPMARVTRKAIRVNLPVGQNQ